MLTYKLYHSDSYSCSRIHCRLLLRVTDYCFNVNLYKYNVSIYGQHIKTTHFNANVHYSIYCGCNINLNDLYTKSLIKRKNIQSDHLIEIYEDGKLIQNVIIIVYGTRYSNVRYNYAITAANSGAGWPPIIPEPYKLECNYVEYPGYYTPTEITNENISMHDNVLYLDDKPLSNNGYYLNECDMYIVDGDVCEIHLPFNIINAKFILDKYKHYKLKFINDNNQLEGHCKTCIIDHQNILQQLRILNDDLMTCTSSIDANKTFDELITFKQTI